MFEMSAASNNSPGAAGGPVCNDMSPNFDSFPYRGPIGDYKQRELS